MTLEGYDLLDILILWTLFSILFGFVVGRFFPAAKRIEDSTPFGEIVEPHGAKLLHHERSNRNRIPSPGARNARATDGGVPVAFEDAPVFSDLNHSGANSRG